MLTKEQFFDKTPTEQIVLFIRRHWLSFLSWILILVAMVVLPAILLSSFWINSPEVFPGSLQPFWIVGCSAYLLITLAVFLTAWINYYLNVTIITSEHLVDIHQSGLFNRKVSEQSLFRVQDVSAKMKGVFQTFFRYGTVLVETAGDIPNFEIENIPYPNRVANTILKLHEQLVEREGIDREQYADGVGLEMIKRTRPEPQSSTLPPEPAVKKEEIKPVIPKPPSEEKITILEKPPSPEISALAYHPNPSKGSGKKDIKMLTGSQKQNHRQAGELKEGELVKL